MIKEIAILLPVFITSFWSLVFFIQKGKTDKGKLQLGYFMLTAFLLYLTHAIFFNGLYNLYAYFESVYIITYLSVYPLYYFYLLIISSHRLSLKLHIIHLAPALIISVLAFVFTLLLTSEERVHYVKEILISKNLKNLSFSGIVDLKGIIFLLSRIVFVLQAGFYVVYGIVIARKHNHRIMNYFSNTDGKTMNWVLILHVFLIIVSFSSITFAFIGRSYFIEHEIALIIPSMIFSVFLFFIGMNGNNQVYVVYDLVEEKPENKTNIPNDEKSLKNQLEQLFLKGEVYKNPELRISTVAESLKTNRTYISNLINDEYQMNFNEFVNMYRVEIARKYLSDIQGEKYTLEYIAEKSGFGSVNSFSRVFKSFEDITPGKFRENVLRKPRI